MTKTSQAAVSAQVLDAAWLAHIKLIRSKMSFSQGKALVHQIFDDAEVARPFVKCLPTHHRTHGFATQEHEIFLQDTTWDDTVIQCASELLLGPVDNQEISNKDRTASEALSRRSRQGGVAGKVARYFQLRVPIYVSHRQRTVDSWIFWGHPPSSG